MTTTWSDFSTGIGNCSAVIESVTVVPYQLRPGGESYDLLRIVITPPQVARGQVSEYRIRRASAADELTGLIYLDMTGWVVPDSDPVPMPLRPPLLCNHFARREASDPAYPYNLMIYPMFYNPPENPDLHVSRILAISTDMAPWGWPPVTHADPTSGPVPLSVDFSIRGLT